jgi:hypothetical protein
MNNKIFILLIVVMSLTLSLFSLGYVIATPSGASLTPGVSTSAQADNPGNNSAIAGNVTELTITGFSNTNAWQGYYGNVSGTIQLADSGRHMMYNWSQANPSGEVYASVNGSITWDYIQCFNFTANGSYNDDSANAGATSLFGMNISQLQAAYNIATDDSDTVNLTFSRRDHAQFYTNSKLFSGGECPNMKVFNSTGQGAFDEALLYEPNSRAVVFASILQKDANGFDDHSHDFEMLVLEDGHSGNIAPTPYYFYMEIS